MTSDPQPTITADETLGTGDHKVIGRLWLFSGLLLVAVGLVLRAVVAFEQIDLSGIQMLEDTFELVQVWSLSRDLVMFGGVAASLVGLALFIVPLQVGASTVAFPRGASGAFWTWVVSSGLLIASYLGNGGPGGGTRDFVVLWALALGGMMVGLCWALVCIATTVLGARAEGMGLEMVPPTAWSFLVFSLLGLLTIPIQVGQLVLAFIDVRGGYVSVADTTSLASVMDTIFLAPAVYWLGVPVLGIALDVIGVHSRRPIEFHRIALAAIGLLAVLAFGAEVTSYGGRGRPIDFANALLVLTLVAAVLPVLATLGLGGRSLRRGEVTMRIPLLAALVSGLVLLLGVAVAILGAVEPIVGFFASVTGSSPAVPDALQVNGTAFNEGVSVLIVTGGLLAVHAGIVHWGHKMFGHSINPALGSLAILALAGGGVLWGAGQVIAGMAGLPALPVYGEVDGGLVSVGNILAMVGVIGLAAGVIMSLGDALLSGLAGQGSVAEPWTGHTLEWTTQSPPGYANFDRPPVVSSLTPALDRMTGDDGDGASDQDAEREREGVNA